MAFRKSFSVIFGWEGSTRREPLKYPKFTIEAAFVAKEDTVGIFGSDHFSKFRSIFSSVFVRKIE